MWLDNPLVWVVTVVIWVSSFGSKCILVSILFIERIKKLFSSEI